MLCELIGEPLKQSANVIGEPIKQSATVIGEPFKQSATVIGEPIKGQVQTGAWQSTGLRGGGLPRRPCRRLRLVRHRRRLQVAHHLQQVAAAVDHLRGPGTEARVQGAEVRVLQIAEGLPLGGQGSGHRKRRYTHWVVGNKRLVTVYSLVRVQAWLG